MCKHADALEANALWRDGKPMNTSEIQSIMRIKNEPTLSRTRVGQVLSNMIARGRALKSADNKYSRPNQFAKYVRKLWANPVTDEYSKGYH